MTTFLLNKDIKNVVTYFNQLVADGIDVKIFLADMVEYLKESMTDDIVQNVFNIDDRMMLADSLITLLASLRNATQVKTLTELALIKMCRNVSTQTVESETKSPAIEDKKAVNEAIQSLPVDNEALKQITDKLTQLEKRMVVNEMMMDQLKFQRR